MRIVKAAAVQFSPVLYNLEAIIEKVCQQILNLGRQGVQYAVLRKPV
jgi:nitrilase